MIEIGWDLAMRACKPLAYAWLPLALSTFVGCSTVHTSALAGERSVDEAEASPPEAFDKGRRWHSPKHDGLHGIDWVRLEQSGCYGPCASFTAVLKAEGTVVYRGREGAPRQGKHKGQLDPEAMGTWRKVLHFISQSRFFQLNERYRVRGADAVNLTLSIHKDGQTHQVASYAGSAPPVIWVIEGLLKDLLKQVNYSKPDTDRSS